MDVFTMVVIIVAISCLAGVLNNHIKSRNETASLDGQDEIEAELDELRARVETLEKIVTDEQYQLRRELDDLEAS